MTAGQRHVMGVAAVVFVVAIAGIGTSFLLPRTYISNTRLFIEPKRGSATDWINEAAAYVLSRKSLRGIIETEGLYKRELERLPMEDLIEKMRRDIQIERIGQVGTVKEVRVSFRHEDGNAAELTTSALMDCMISARTAADVLAADQSLQPLSLEVADPPRPVSTAGFGQIGSALRRVASAVRHGQITYVGVLRVRRPRSASVGAPDANELRDMVLAALKELAYLEPEGGSINAAMAKMRRRFRFETGRSGDELYISYSDASPAQAQRTLQELVARVLEGHMAANGPVIEQRDPPSLPSHYEELTPGTMAIAGAGVGLLLGLAGLRFFAKRDPSGPLVLQQK